MKRLSAMLGHVESFKCVNSDWPVEGTLHLEVLESRSQQERRRPTGTTEASAEPQGVPVHHSTLA